MSPRWGSNVKGDLIIINMPPLRGSVGFDVGKLQRIYKLKIIIRDAKFASPTIYGLDFGVCYLEVLVCHSVRRGGWFRDLKKNKQMPNRVRHDVF